MQIRFSIGERLYIYYCIIFELKKFYMNQNIFRIKVIDSKTFELDCLNTFESTVTSRKYTQSLGLITHSKFLVYK